MAITLLPVDADPTTGLPEYAAIRARQATAATYGNPTDKAFDSRSGWRVGTPTNVVSVTSSAWTLQPCSAMISPGATATQGTYGFSNDAALGGTLTAADANNPRIDLLYIQVSDLSAGDGSSGRTAEVKYLAGTPALSPVAPALPARSWEVGKIPVPQAGTGLPSFIMNQQFFTSAGGITPVVSKADRDSIKPYVGLQVCRLDRDGWTQQCMSVSPLKWEYPRPSRRIWANNAGIVSATGASTRLVYTMPTTDTVRPYPQTVSMGGRVTLSSGAISVGQLNDWIDASISSSSAGGSQSRSSVFFTAPGGYPETREIGTGPVNVAANTDPIPRLWIERSGAGSVNSVVSTDTSFTKFFVDLRPQDD